MNSSNPKMPLAWLRQVFQALQDAAVAAILDSAARSIEERGRFLLVLSGGETPREIFND